MLKALGRRAPNWKSGCWWQRRLLADRQSHPVISARGGNAVIKFNCRNSLQPLLFATALPLFLLAGGGAPVFAGSISVTGANGANGAPGKPGGAGGSATATATSSVPSNSATATGGNG